MATLRNIPPVPAVRLFRALADETRLRILRLLASGEWCVCHLVAELGLPQPTVSRHLAYLRKAGFVQSRRQANWMHYRLADKPSPLHRRLLDCLNESPGPLPEAPGEPCRLPRRRGRC